MKILTEVRSLVSWAVDVYLAEIQRAQFVSPLPPPPT